MSILESVKQARNTKKNFIQSFDVSISLKNFDVKKNENKIKGEIILPFPRKTKICVIADSLVPAVQKLNDEDIILIKKEEISSFDKKKAKKLANECSVFLAEAPLMPVVAKQMGQVLGPRNKIPKPIMPTAQNIKPIIETAKKTIRYAIKNSPVINCFAGKEDMKDEDVAKNIETILRTITGALPNGKNNIANVYVKLTMGKPVKIEL